jgi:TetR/AcrR family transcriptional repressor of nem operon
MSDTKTRILEVAEDLIRRFGLNGMSYHHISEAVGISKASIHHHFPKKENLVEDLLNSCRIAYGSRYKVIVDGEGSAPEKLRLLAGVFADGLKKEKICLVGTISADLNSLQVNSRKILETTIQSTVDIFTIPFKQGRKENSISITGKEEDMAYTFYSFLLGAQISARAHGGAESFQNATEALIKGWEI